MAELKATRLTDLSLGSTIDDAMTELEADLAVLLGINVGESFVSAAVVPQSEVGTANGVASLNASSLVVENPAAATTSAETASIVMTATDWAYIHSSWGGTASSLATLNASAEVVQDPANAVTVPGANKIVQADSTTFSGGGYIDPTWVGASWTAAAYKVVRVDSTGVLDSAWAGSAYATLTDGALEYSINAGGLGAVASHATGTRGMVAKMRTPISVTVSTGYIYRLDTDGKLRNAIANTASACTGMLVMALENIPPDDEGDVLLWGFTEALKMESGCLLYLSSTVSGDVVTTAPTSTGTIVRLVGYGLGALNGIIFDPDQTWIEL